MGGKESNGVLGENFSGWSSGKQVEYSLRLKALLWVPEENMIPMAEDL